MASPPRDPARILAGGAPEGFDARLVAAGGWYADTWHYQQLAAAAGSLV